MDIGQAVAGVLVLPSWLNGLLLIGVVAVAASYLYATWTFSYFTKLGIKGPKPKLLYGTLTSAMTEGINRHDQLLYEKYIKQKVCGIYEGRLPVLMVLDVNMIEHILVKDFSSFSNRRSLEHVSPLLNNGLLGLQGDHWVHVRSLTAEALAPSKLSAIFSSLSMCTERIAEYVTIQAEKGNSFNAQSLFTAYSTDATARIFFGANIDSISDPDNAYIRYTREILQQAYNHPLYILYFFVPFLAKIVQMFGWKLIPKHINTFFTLLIQQAFRIRMEYPGEFPDFIESMMYLEVDSQSPNLINCVDCQGRMWSSKGLTMNEILAQSVTLFITSFETTALTLTYTTWCLARYPDIQEKVLEELDQVTSPDKELSFDYVNQLCYLEMVILEVLRLYPPSVRNERMANRDIVIDGVFIPKNLIIAIPVSALHKDPRFWPDPERFNPDRFTAEAKAKRHPLCYQPFGAGPRCCVGSRLALMEIKYLLASILMKVKFVPTSETVEEIVMQKSGSNIPEKSIIVGVELRDW